MTGATDPDAPDDRLSEALSWYLDARERGHTPTPEEYLARYPDCAAALTAFAAAHQQIGGLLDDLRPSPGRASGDNTESYPQSAPCVRVVLPKEAAPPPRDVRELLRYRLRLIALFVALGLALTRGVGLLFDYPWVLAEPWAAFTRPPCYGNAALVVCLQVVLLVVLAPGRRHGLPQLRVLEALEFGLLSAAIAWNATLDLAGSAPVIGEQYGLALAYGTSLPWVLLMIGYGVLVPNTWRRCGAAIALFVLLAILPDLFVLVGSRMAPGSLAVYLANKSLWLGIAAAIVVFGARRLEALGREAAVGHQLGQYRLKSRIGSGGMGEVYLAEHVLLHRPCAIKLIKPQRTADPKNLLRFEREVRTTATLSHPNTVQVYDYGFAEGGTFYYVMEYLPGLTLEQLVRDHGPMPPGRAVHLLRQVCGALREAHAVGLIHRDVKPGNILICARGGQPDVAKLLDFGLVLVQGGGAGQTDLTAENAIAGTPHYMSPEQAAGREDVDRRADIYSLGAVAYFLLTGRPPFAGRLVGQVLAAHQYEAPVPLTRHRPDLPAELEAVVLQCLAKAPAERHQNARDLDRALAECLPSTDWGEAEAVAWWAKHQKGLVAVTATQEGPDGEQAR
jgi:serine/threonine-protein kinase